MRLFRLLSHVACGCYIRNKRDAVKETLKHLIEENGIIMAEKDHIMKNILTEMTKWLKEYKEEERRKVSATGAAVPTGEPESLDAQQSISTGAKQKKKKKSKGKKSSSKDRSYSVGLVDGLKVLFVSDSKGKTPKVKQVPTPVQSPPSFVGSLNTLSLLLPLE